MESKIINYNNILAWERHNLNFRNKEKGIEHIFKIRSLIMMNNNLRSNKRSTGYIAMAFSKEKDI